MQCRYTAANFFLFFKVSCIMIERSRHFTQKRITFYNLETKNELHKNISETNQPAGNSTKKVFLRILAITNFFYLILIIHKSLFSIYTKFTLDSKGGGGRREVQIGDVRI